MKLLKKIMAGALSLAVICGAMFAFVGCNEVKGKTYAFDTLTFTIVTEFENDENIGTDKAVIKATRTLSAREFYLYKEEEKTLEELATATTEATDKEILEWCEGYIATVALLHMDMELEMYQMYKGSKIEFKKNTIEVIYEQPASKITGDYEKMVNVAEYSVEDGVIKVETNTSSNPDTMYQNYQVMSFNIVGENIEKVYTVKTEAAQYAKNELVSFAMVLAEVK